MQTTVHHNAATNFLKICQTRTHQAPPWDKRTGRYTLPKPREKDHRVTATSGDLLDQPSLTTGSFRADLERTAQVRAQSGGRACLTACSTTQSPPQKRRFFSCTSCLSCISACAHCLLYRQQALPKGFWLHLPYAPQPVFMQKEKSPVTPPGCTVPALSASPCRSHAAISKSSLWSLTSRTSLSPSRAPWCWGARRPPRAGPIPVLRGTVTSLSPAATLVLRQPGMRCPPLQPRLSS